MVQSNRWIERNVSSTFQLHWHAAYIALSVSPSSSLHPHIRYSECLQVSRVHAAPVMHFYARLFSGSPCKREAPRGTVCFPAVCRTVNSERVACMARRVLLHDGNGSWLNAEGGRRWSSPGLKFSGAMLRGRAIPGKRYLTGDLLGGLPGNQPISHGQFPAVPDVQSPPPSMGFRRYRSQNRDYASRGSKSYHNNDQMIK